MCVCVCVCAYSSLLDVLQQEIQCRNWSVTTLIQSRRNCKSPHTPRMNFFCRPQIPFTTSRKAGKVCTTFVERADLVRRTVVCTQAPVHCINIPQDQRQPLHTNPSPPPHRGSPEPPPLTGGHPSPPSPGVTRAPPHRGSPEPPQPGVI